MSSSASVQGQELIEGRAFLDACEARWLVTLVEFDTAEAYEVDGHVSCVAWLVDRCGMGRSTAKEKVRVAHELARRPVIGDAFINGVLSYSKARAMTRLAGLHDERDAAFIDEYAGESTDTIERIVRLWNLRNGDDPAPPDPYDKPAVRFQPGFSGAHGRIIIEGNNEDLARIVNVVDAYGSFLFFNAKEASGVASAEPPVLRADDTDDPAVMTMYDPMRWNPDPEAVDEASAEPPRSLSQRRFDWFLDLIEEIALVRDDQLDPARATVGVVVAYESLIGDPQPGDAGLLDAGPIVTGEAVRQMCCDADISRMVTNGASEILDLGRDTRAWNRAQRRAARFRHGHRCAAATAASPNSTISTTGATEDTPPSKTRCRSALGITTWFTTAAGPSTSTQAPASSRSPAHRAKPSTPKPTCSAARRRSPPRRSAPWNDPRRMRRMTP